MIITCPNCKINFSVPDEVIPELGRNVKCSKCSNIWHVKKNADNLTSKPQEQIVPIITDSNKLPAIHTAENNVTFIISSFIMLVVTILINFVIYFEPISSTRIGLKALSLINCYDTKHFAIQDIRIRPIRYQGKYSIFLKYRIYNDSATIQETPWVRIKFFDHDNKLFYTHIGTNSKFKFQPFQNVPTQTEFQNLKFEPSRIEISLGNKIELYSR